MVTVFIVMLILVISLVVVILVVFLILLVLLLAYAMKGTMVSFARIQSLNYNLSKVS